MKLKQLWDEFMYDRTKLVAGFDLSCFVAAVAAVVLMFFLPASTFFQWFLVGLFAGVNVIIIFLIMFFYPDTSAEDTYLARKVWGWCMLASVIIWMFPIPVNWALIPLTVGILIETSVEEGELKIGQTCLVFMFFAICFIYTQYNIDKKLHLQSNPVPEVVVLSNYDRGQSVFFIKGQDNCLKLDGYKALKQAGELDLEKGDTVKIVRHPNVHKHVIKITR
ncbi:MAG: hypothetical protein IJ019_07005 [Alphaproteobacteria bacterium]|nr:hypothetical protein [Alphaproteobacteria bacterium]